MHADSAVAAFTEKSGKRREIIIAGNHVGIGDDAGGEEIGEAGKSLKFDIGGAASKFTGEDITMGVLRLQSMKIGQEFMIALEWVELSDFCGVEE